MLNKLHIIDRLLDYVQNSIGRVSPSRLKKSIDLLDEADIADLINAETDSENRLRLFNLVANDKKGDVLVLLNKKISREILLEISDKKIGHILNALDSDDAVDLLSELSLERRRLVLARLDPEHARNILSLMKYPPDSAGGLMQAEFPYVYSSDRCEDALQSLQRYDDIETAHMVYVVDEKKKYVGEVSVWTLITSPDDELVANVCNRTEVVVDAFMDQEKVAWVFQQYDVVHVAVVDADNTLIGSITVDDIVDVIHNEAHEDMLRMGGISGKGDVDDLLFEQSVTEAIKSRVLWLGGALMGGLVTGSVLWGFRSALEEVIVLSVFIPVVMGTAGNVATQSSTIMVRSIAMGMMEKMKVSILLVKELSVGFAIGIMAGLAVSGATLFFQSNVLLGAVVGASMFGAVFTAAIIGVITPLLFQKINVDPAIAAGPIVLTINDLTALLIYFAIANHFIDRLQ